MMDIEETRQEYRNIQFVRAGDSTTAVQVDETPSPKPDGKSKTFTLRFPVATKPIIKINTVAIDPADIGINGLDKNKKWYWQKNSRQVTQDDAETVLPDTSTITVSYQGLKPIIVRAENTTGIDERKLQEGGTGFYENLINEKNIDDKSAAIQFANGYLKKYGDISQKVNIYTSEQRHAGQLIPIQSTQLDINDYYLITSANVALDDLGRARYTITAASGEDLGGWVEFFRNLKPSEQLEVRENEILVKVRTQTEIQGVQSSSTIKKFNALYPSDALYPSETLYPNTSAIDTEVLND
jgi:hypothetical protein